MRLVSFAVFFLVTHVNCDELLATNASAQLSQQDCWGRASEIARARYPWFSSNDLPSQYALMANFCCDLVARRPEKCSVHSCDLPDKGPFKESCWPGVSSGFSYGACCDFHKSLGKTTRAPIWMQKEVDEDFAWHAGRRLRRERIAEVEREFGDLLCRFRIDDYKLQVGATKGCNSVYWGPAVMQWFQHALEMLLGAQMIKPNLDFLVLHRDADYDFGLPSDIPILAHGAPNCGKGFILFPLHDCMSGMVEKLYELDTPFLSETVPKNRNVSKRLRKKAVWRGAVRHGTQCGSDLDGKCRCSFGLLEESPRSRLMDLGRSHPRHLDVHNSQKGGANAYQINLDCRAFAFHLSVDAKAYSTLSNWRPLVFERVLIKQASDVKIAWFRHGLLPYVHYLPVRYDLSDLIDKINWANSHPIDVDRIRRAGVDFAYLVLKQCRLLALLHIKAILDQYAKLQSWT